MPRTLVTGAAGFLGSHIADALSEAGHEVVLLDRRTSPWKKPGQTMITGDILDQKAVHEAVTGCDHVYHLAALADLNEARTRPLETAQTNILGTVQLLEAAREARVKRFLFASTVYVYSREGGFYRASKQACEGFVEEYQRSFGLPFTVLRYGSLYGPRADESNGVHRLLRAAMTEKRVRYTGSPDDVREYVHVADAARLSMQALAPEFENQHLTVSGHHPMRLRDLFTMFSEILGHPVDVEYVEPTAQTRDGHYRVTPYAYTPKLGLKLTPSAYVDMGQGIIQCCEEIAQRADKEGRDH